MAGKAIKQATVMASALETARKAVEDEQRQANLIQEDIDPDDYVDFIPVAPPSHDEQVLLNVLDELREVDGAQVRVYRHEKGKPMEYLFSPHFCDDLLGSIMEQLQMEYGRGTYRIQARVPGGALKLNREISIGEMPKSKKEEMERAKPVAPPVDNSFREMMQWQMQQQESSKREMLQMFTMMQQQQTSLLTAMLSRPEPAKTEGLTLQDALALAAALNGGKADPMETFIKGMEMGKDIGGDGGDGIAGIAKSAFSSLGGILEKLPKPAAQPVPVMMPPMQRMPNPLPPAQVPAQPVPPVTAAPDPVADPVALLGGILPVGATRHGDPYTYAGLVLDIIGDEQGAELCASPDNMAMVLQAIPALVGHEAWLEQVRQCVVHLLGGAEPANVGGDDDPEGNDAPDDPAQFVTGIAPDQDGIG